jgi:RNA polymerase sigma-70 factor (ECF subfamily)
LRHSALYHPDEYAIAFQNGDEEALSYFFRELHPALTHYANHWVNNLQLAQEIASEAFVKTWQKHDKLNSSTGIRSYLYTIVRRDSQKIANRQRSRPEVYIQTPPESFHTETPFHYLVRSETYRLLYAAIQQLSPGNQRVIAMHFFEGKSTGEIARELNLHPHTVQTQKSRGIKALQKILQLPFLWLCFSFLKNFLSNL